MDSEFEKVVQNPLWDSFKNGLGEDSLKTSKSSVGTSRLQEWMVGSVVHFGLVHWTGLVQRKSPVQNCSCTGLTESGISTGA